MKLFERLFSSNKLDPNLKRLFAYLLNEKKKLIAAFLFMALSAASSSLIATLLGKLTDLGFYQKESWVLWGAPLGLIGIAVLHGGSMFASTYLLSKVSQDVLETIRLEMFKKMLHWPAKSYQNVASGLFSTRFLNEANAMLTSSAQLFVRLFRDLLQVIALLFVLIYYNWQLSFVTLVIAPIIVYILKAISRMLKKVMESNQKSIAHLMSTAQEAYRAQAIIKLYNSYELENQKFKQLNEMIRALVMKMISINSLGMPLTQIVAMLGVAVVLTIALIQAQNGSISFGEFITFLAAMLLLLPPLRNLAQLNGALVGMTVAAQGIFSTLDIEKEKDRGEKELGAAFKKITFDSVSLMYPQAKHPALKNFNLTISAGEHIALVGASGSGKTSLINLIPRFWEPSKGQILFDETNYLDLSLRSLRSRISIVSQNTFLFNESIRYNLTYGLGEVAEEKIREALKAVSLLEFVDSLPEGLETIVGEGGGKLSGGQKQRLSIVRALLKDAPILILDEATSALDSETEFHFQKALEVVMKGRTCITVAHRLSTIKSADRIIVMDKGEIQEIGQHEELMTKNGIYANLVRLQSLSFVQPSEAENV